MAQSTGLGLIPMIWKGIRELNPETVKREAFQTFTIGIIGSDDKIDSVLSQLMAGMKLNDIGMFVRRYDPSVPNELERSIGQCDLVICADDSLRHDPKVLSYRYFIWDFANPENTINAILEQKKIEGIHLSLARNFPGFRKSINSLIIRGTSMENAVFVASTAIGNILPNPLAPLASLAESAGDMVVLTANQVRMLFRLAAANGQPIGYMELLPQAGSIIAASFGWRAIARELIGMIPFGAGLVGKAAIAYAGTWAVGEGILLYFTSGKKMTSREYQEKFKERMLEAREVSSRLVESVISSARSRRSRLSDADKTDDIE